MPHLQGIHITAESTAVLLALRGKVRQRFYEPLVLLLALTQACMHQHAPRILDPVSDCQTHSPSELFQDFINKLCQICDNKPGGSSVTSISALEYPDRVQYRFASNQRSEGDLLKVKYYLEDILETLKGYTVTSAALIRAKVLRRIVAFNRPRLQCYIKKLANQTHICLEKPKMSPELSEKLSQLRDLALKADDREIEEHKFYPYCTDLMVFIKEDFSKSTAYKSLRERASSNGGEPSPWADLCHSAGRLLSYFQACKTLVQARKEWERLFHEFEVVWVRSSIPQGNPITRKNVNAAAIIGRMTGDPAKIVAYRADAEELQIFDLDVNIRDQVARPSFKPLVHAEVLIHQSVLDESGPAGLRASQFFNRYMYVGSSKPTCRLCDYYFTACASGIEVRKSHRNLYVNWRAPDVYSHQGGAALERREKILNKMLDRIRDDTFRTLSEKVPERKKNDSNTDPTFPSLNLGTSVGFDGGVRDSTLEDDLAAAMGQFGLHGPVREVKVLRPAARAVEFDEDGDEGGAQL